jgi:hypothetical protein
MERLNRSRTRSQLIRQGFWYSGAAAPSFSSLNTSCRTPDRVGSSIDEVNALGEFIHALDGYFLK